MKTQTSLRLLIIATIAASAFHISGNEKSGCINVSKAAQFQYNKADKSVPTPDSQFWKIKDEF